MKCEHLCFPDGSRVPIYYLCYEGRLQEIKRREKQYREKEALNRHYTRKLNKQ